MEIASVAYVPRGFALVQGLPSFLILHYGTAFQDIQDNKTSFLYIFSEVILLKNEESKRFPDCSRNLKTVGSRAEEISSVGRKKGYCQKL